MGYFHTRNKIYLQKGSAKSLPCVPIDYLQYYCSPNEPKLSFDFEMLIRLYEMEKLYPPKGSAKALPSRLGPIDFSFQLLLPSMN